MSNILENLMGNVNDTMSKFDSFQKNFAAKNLGSPQSVVQKLMDEGKMSAAQFEQYRNVAARFGMKF